MMDASFEDLGAEGTDGPSDPCEERCVLLARNRLEESSESKRVNLADIDPNDALNRYQGVTRSPRLRFASLTAVTVPALSTSLRRALCFLPLSCRPIGMPRNLGTEPAPRRMPRPTNI